MPVLLFCISYTAWASWSPAANNLEVNRIHGPFYGFDYLPPMINSEGNVMMTIDRSVITAYGRAPNSDWNKIGELLPTDPILSAYNLGETFDGFIFEASSSLEKFVTYINAGWDGSNNQQLPAKIITLHYTNNVWSSSEFALPSEYINIEDIGISKNGQRIAIKTELQSLYDDNGMPTNPNYQPVAIVVFENILGAWVKVGEPILMIDDIIWPTLDEN